MTDEQLRAMARRVLETVVCPTMCNGGKLRFYPRPEMNGVLCASAIDAAVAIMREELAKAQAANYAMAEELFPFIPHPNDDDPTKSFVATT